ncbi:NUDIX domain-containing protein [Aneurinibacillus sp. REN35]|uniref:NUDIX domain-containing protein n=1 Tax=Aneurinibacillus sp. REN35 TaxID=3237286 RepID=UPI003529468D
MRYHHCPKCGGALALNEKKETSKPYCTVCGYIFYQNPAVGVAAIIMRDGKILLGQRQGSYEGQWCIPCGYVEWDEDVHDALRREFYEETGLTIAVQRVYAVHSNFHNPHQHTVGIWFLAEEEGGILAAADDLMDVAFFSYDTLPVLAFPTDIKVLEQLKTEGMLA